MKFSRSDFRDAEVRIPPPQPGSRVSNPTKKRRIGYCKVRYRRPSRSVEKRLREELADLQVEINEEKSRIVDLGRGESFGFLGFDFRRIRSRRGAWRANYTPKLKKRTALLRKLKDVFRRYQSQPVDQWPRRRLHLHLQLVRTMHDDGDARHRRLLRAEPVVRGLWPEQPR